MSEIKLTEHQRAVLTEMANSWRYPVSDGRWAMAQWVAEGAGHTYDTPWAASQLPGLIRRGLVERGTRGYYRITPAGLTVLQAPLSQDR